ncbi:MAG: Tol-Pal system subunit TolQ, partial [Parasphingorhabdus sp.]
MLDQLSLGATTGSFSPFMLFLEADIVVKTVMVGLLLASVW